MEEKEEEEEREIECVSTLVLNPHFLGFAL